MPLSDTPPEELRQLLVGATLGKDLTQATTIRTTRHRHRVTTDGALRLELADDTVRASTGAELLHGARSKSNWAPVSPSHPRSCGSDYAQEGPNLPSIPPNSLTPQDRPPRRDPIHDTRVVIRRLRSTLRVFGEVLHAVPANLDAELT